jgi:uncharacterized membrane protein
MGFFEDYFINPIVEQGVAGYNIYNTPVYALLFCLAVLGSYRLLKKLNIPIDRKFVIGIFPYLLFGGTVRVVRDAAIVPSPLLVSPIIYFVVFVAAVAGLLIGAAIQKATKKPTIVGFKDKAKADLSVAGGVSYHLPWSLIGILLWVNTLALLFPLGLENAGGLGMIAGLAAVWGAAVFAVHRAKIMKWLTLENAGLLWVHLFDASSTFVALQFFPGYYEQHVVSSALIAVVGPAGQFLLKLIVVPIVLVILDRELAKPDERQLRSFLKIAILILGFAPGLRNTIRLALGV